MANNWGIDKTVVLSFSDGTKALAAGEIAVVDYVSSVSPITDLDGTDTLATYTRIVAPTGTTGPGFGNNTLSFPPYISAASMGDGWYMEAAGTPSVIQIGNLDAGQKFDVIFAASRNATDNRNTLVTLVEGTTSSASAQTFNAANPASGTEAPHVIFTDVEPNGSGVIQLSFEAGSGASFAYLGAIAITRIAAGVTVATDNLTAATTLSDPAITYKAIASANQLTLVTSLTSPAISVSAAITPADLAIAINLTSPGIVSVPLAAANALTHTSQFTAPAVSFVAESNLAINSLASAVSFTSPALNSAPLIQPADLTLHSVWSSAYINNGIGQLSGGIIVCVNPSIFLIEVLQ